MGSAANFSHRTSTLMCFEVALGSAKFLPVLQSLHQVKDAPMNTAELRTRQTKMPLLAPSPPIPKSIRGVAQHSRRFFRTQSLCLVAHICTIF